MAQAMVMLDAGQEDVVHALKKIDAVSFDFKFTQ